MRERAKLTSLKYINAHPQTKNAPLWQGGVSINAVYDFAGVEVKEKYSEEEAAFMVFHKRRLWFLWRLGGFLTDPRVEWSRGNLGGSV